MAGREERGEEEDEEGRVRLFVRERDRVGECFPEKEEKEKAQEVKKRGRSHPT